MHVSCHHEHSMWEIRVSKDRDVLLAFYDFPAEQWMHIRTTNPIESTFATVRLRTKRTKGSGSRAACLAMVFKLTMCAEKTWRALNGSTTVTRCHPRRSVRRRSAALSEEDISTFTLLEGPSRAGCPESAQRCVLTEEDITIFIKAGHAVIAELMRHIRDHRSSPWRFHFAPSSGPPNHQNMMIGELACYMIEAILRVNPWFTTTGRLDYLPSDNVSDSENGQTVLHQAATAYEQWYDKCFDENTMSVTCSEDGLPLVGWGL